MKGLKKLLAVVLAVACICGTLSVAAISDADFVAPKVDVPSSMVHTSHKGLTDSEDYILGEGTPYEIKVTTDFIPDSGHANRPSPYTAMSQKYIVVHNTGNYAEGSWAINNHSYIRDQSPSMSWHFTCGNDGIYQALPLNEKGWHTGSADSSIGVSDAMQSNCIGIETCVNAFPATSTSGGEQWNTDEMYEWYANQFDETVTYLSMLVASMCLQLNFNPHTQVIQHWDVYGKNCPMQMRYVFGTNATFDYNGTYYKVFWARMIAFYEAMGGTYKPTDTCYNLFSTTTSSAAYSYTPGSYKASSAVTVYSAGNTSTSSVGSVASGETVSVSLVSNGWGKITLANGNAGWVKLSNFSRVNGYQTGYYRANSAISVYSTASTSGTAVASVAANDVVEVTALSGSFGYVTVGGVSGYVNLASTTRVYALNVLNSAAFGSGTKFYAAGETVSLTADAAPTDLMFDQWAATKGAASFAQKTASSTVLTMRAADTEITAKYKDIEYNLTVENGVGNGSYQENTVVNIKASTLVGKKFTHWTLESGEGVIAEPTKVSTTFTTTAVDSVVKANYVNYVGSFDDPNLVNYASGVSYTVTAGGSSPSYRNTAQGDSSFTKLTDGQYSTEEFSDSSTNSSYQKEVVYSGSGNNYVMTFNLGQNREITAVALRDICLVSWDSVWGSYDDTALKVEYSTNGSTYYEVSNLVDVAAYAKWGTTTSEHLINHSLEFDLVTAKYVRITLKSLAYLFGISEVQIFGGTTYTLAVENGIGDGSYVTGRGVVISADTPEENAYFDHWELVSGTGTFSDAKSATTIFTISANSSVKAVYGYYSDFILTEEAKAEGKYSLNTEELVSGVSAMTAADVKAIFVAEVTVKDASGNALATDAVVGTGCTVTDGEYTATVIVTGDIDGDGLVNTTDVASVKASIKENTALEGVFAKAADTNKDSKISTLDYIRIKLASKLG
ncbi:MAG: N-acetylmuramoyl-L-alanine amidase [Clostridia bacterium]|nr:N-acetylmuramoyl-L-alanine amidase [Clostridia bacterium]